MSEIFPFSLVLPLSLLLLFLFYTSPRAVKFMSFLISSLSRNGELFPGPKGRGSDRHAGGPILTYTNLAGGSLLVQ